MNRQTQSRRGLIAAGVALSLLGALVGSVLGSRFNARNQPSMAATGVRVPAGEASPPSGSDTASDSGAVTQGKIKIPPRLPQFTLSDRFGKPTSIATWGGKSLILNFWATWCAPCRREIPLLKSVAAQWGPRGTEVVGIAVDHRDQVSAYADALKIPYPILVGEQDALDVAASLGVESPAFPFTVFTDRQGRVVTLFVGELHASQVDLILSAVKEVNDDHLALADAQLKIASALQAENRRTAS